MNGNIAARVQVMVGIKRNASVVLCKAAESTGSAVQSMQLLYALQPQYADETNPSQANHETNLARSIAWH